jgi:hydroxyquinol 1,2-dioxygenase
MEDKSLSITQSVIKRFANTPDPRLKEIMTSLVTHLHGFARDVQLTEGEWFKAIEFLTATGQKCTDTRQEFILLSDVLGLSMVTVEINNRKPVGCTDATVFGPFFVPNAPEYKLGDEVSNGARGKPCYVSGVIRGPKGEIISNAKIDVWQADDDGLYDVQKPDLNQAQARGTLHSNEQGQYYFRTVVAEPYPIPTDGPVGKLLDATNRPSMRPAHLHFMIQAPGYETLITHVFRRDDKYLDADPVLGVRESLVADWVAQADGTTKLDFDFVLKPCAA